MRTKPYPGFIFQAWAYFCGVSVGAQYMLEDGHMSRPRARVEILIGDAMSWLLGWLWWWA